MTDDIEGFYAIYVTSKTGYGAMLLALRNGKLVGADAHGVTIDGQYSHNQGYCEIGIEADIPPGLPLVQGGTSGPSRTKYQLRFGFMGKPEQYPYLRIETPLGPLNVKFVRLRGLDV